MDEFLAQQPVIFVLSAFLGSVLTFLGNIIIQSYRYKSDEHKYSQQRIELILNSSEEYREELRRDMFRMSEEMKKLKADHENEMVMFREKYEKIVNEMQDQINTLSEEIEKYRQENSALHLLLQKEGIEIPNWVRKE